MSSRGSVTAQGKSCQKLLFEETFSVDPANPGSAPKAGIMFFDDRRLFNIAALTYNEVTCNEIMSLIASGLTPSDDWVTLQKSLLLLRTIVLHGSEIAVDKAIQFSPEVCALQTYNSALAPRRSSFFSSSSKGGTDFGAPVRKEAVLLFKLLNDDNEIRNGRAAARSSETLVPMGQKMDANFGEEASESQSLTFGQAPVGRVGAGYGMKDVPNVYDGRPDRYRDGSNSGKNNSNNNNSYTDSGNNYGNNINTVLDSQYTRDKQAPDLLDMHFDTAPAAAELPDALFLPGLQREQELERKLAEQQQQLEMLKQQQQQQLRQQQQQQQQQQFLSTPPLLLVQPQSQLQPQYNPGVSADFDLLTPIPTISPMPLMPTSMPMPTMPMPTMPMPTPPMQQYHQHQSPQMQGMQGVPINGMTTMQTNMQTNMPTNMQTNMQGQGPGQGQGSMSPQGHGLMQGLGVQQPYGAQSGSNVVHGAGMQGGQGMAAMKHSPMSVQNSMNGSNGIGMNGMSGSMVSTDSMQPAKPLVGLMAGLRPSHTPQHMQSMTSSMQSLSMQPQQPQQQQQGYPMQPSHPMYPPAMQMPPQQYYTATNSIPSMGESVNQPPAVPLNMVATMQMSPGDYNMTLQHYTNQQHQQQHPQQQQQQQQQQQHYQQQQNNPPPAPMQYSYNQPPQIPSFPPPPPPM